MKQKSLSISFQAKFDINRLLEQMARGLSNLARKIFTALKRTDRGAKKDSFYHCFPVIRPYVDKTDMHWSYLTGLLMLIGGLCFLLLIALGENRYHGFETLLSYAIALLIGLGMLHTANLLFARGNKLWKKLGRSRKEVA